MLVMFLGIVGIYTSQIGAAAIWANPQLGDMLIIGATIMWALENVIARCWAERQILSSLSRECFSAD